MAKRVAIIDDDADHLELMALALADAPLAVELDLYRSGGAALQALWTCRDDELPALVLLDVRLGVESGFDVLRTLKADRRYSSIPVVMHSSSIHQRDVSLSRELGACAYVVKRTEFGAMRSSLVEVVEAWAR